ncbi:MAG: hypothetical protein IJ366_07830 [Clostridia bacterium]|nr:hypothetical protein [Clostridia bacterium]
MNHIINNKNMMATIFAKSFNELHPVFAAVMEDDVHNNTNSSFFFIPSDSKKASCTVMQGSEKYFFMRLPISLLKDFVGSEGVTVPSEDVIFYAVPLTCNEKNTLESVYMFCVLQNNSGTKNSQLPEAEIYRISIANRNAMNEIADKYYAE